MANVYDMMTALGVPPANEGDPLPVWMRPLADGRYLHFKLMAGAVYIIDSLDLTPHLWVPSQDDLLHDDYEVMPEDQLIGHKPTDNPAVDLRVDKMTAASEPPPETTTG
jgi:hypothetical protein